MKFFVLAMCVCAAAAAPQFRPYAQTAGAAAKPYSGDEKSAETLRSDSDVQPNGYSYSYETSNSISAQESGELKKIGEIESIVAQGSFQYPAPDGQVIQLSYKADENGYQPIGDILPTPPPTPDHVLRLLEFIEKNPPPVEYSTGPVYQKRNF